MHLYVADGEDDSIMFDPGEGVDFDGTIRTGVDRSKVPSAFEPLLVACAKAVSDASPSASLYLYGSVATGMVRRATSDIDLLTVGLPPPTWLLSRSN